MLSRFVLALGLSVALILPAAAGEILVVRKSDALRFTGPFAPRTPVVTRDPADFMASPCGCDSALYGPCGCVVVTDRRGLSRETSVHRSGIGADSTIRANNESGDGPAGYLYFER